MAAVPVHAAHEDNATGKHEDCRNPALSMLCLGDIFDEHGNKGTSTVILDMIRRHSAGAPIPPYTHIQSPDGGTGFVVCTCTEGAAQHASSVDRDVPEEWKEKLQGYLDEGMVCDAVVVDLDIGDLVCLEVRHEWIPHDWSWRSPAEERIEEMWRYVRLRAQWAVQDSRVCGQEKAKYVVGGTCLLIPFFLFRGRLDKRVNTAFQKLAKTSRIEIEAKGCRPSRVRHPTRIWACSLGAPAPVPSDASVGEQSRQWCCTGDKVAIDAE